MNISGLRSVDMEMRPPLAWVCLHFNRTVAAATAWCCGGGWQMPLFRAEPGVVLLSTKHRGNFIFMPKLDFGTWLPAYNILYCIGNPIRRAVFVWAVASVRPQQTLWRDGPCHGPLVVRTLKFIFFFGTGVRSSDNAIWWIPIMRFGSKR